MGNYRERWIIIQLLKIMNYLVPTHLRVGSTLLCEALSILLDEKITPLEFTEEELADTEKEIKRSMKQME